MKSIFQLFKGGFHTVVTDQYTDPVAYEAWVRTFSGRGKLARHIADLFCEYLPIANEDHLSKKLLDLAAGSGIISIELHKRGYQVTASDISSEMLEPLRLSHSGIERVVCDFNKPLPFADLSFDGVTTVWANRYITTEGLQVFLSEVYRVLKPNGVFLWPLFPMDRILWKVKQGKGQVTSAESLAVMMKDKGFSEATELRDLFYKNMFSFKLPPQTVPIYILGRK